MLVCMNCIEFAESIQSIYELHRGHDDIKICIFRRFMLLNKLSSWLQLRVVAAVVPGVCYLIPRFWSIIGHMGSNHPEQFWRLLEDNKLQQTTADCTRTSIFKRRAAISYLRRSNCQWTLTDLVCFSTQCCRLLGPSRTYVKFD